MARAAWVVSSASALELHRATELGLLAWGDHLNPKRRSESYQGNRELRKTARLECCLEVGVRHTGKPSVCSSTLLPKQNAFSAYYCGSGQRCRSTLAMPFSPGHASTPQCPISGELKRQKPMYAT